MRHLTTEQLVDLAEGIETESSTEHVRSCGDCRRRITDLRGTISAVGEVEAPEPSPLFWEHFSARVSDAVESDRGSSGAAPRRRFYLAGARLAEWLGRPVAAVSVSLIVVAVTALLLRSGRPVPAPSASEPVSVTVEAPPGETAASVDDPSLSLVADLAADLDWDSVREAGLTTHIGVDDDALALLTAGERNELRRLLQGELSSSRRGA
ncbi:MAG: hypothetical protein ABJA98_12975 [Acidobacteriota bacterium]